MTEEVKFNVLVSLFNWIQKSKTWVQKRSKFRKFLDTYCKPRDYFAALRLILPSLDRERGSYGLKESVLATCLIDALDMSRDSSDAVRLINWRKGGAAKTGANAGNFALVAAEILQLRQGMASAGLTIKELNDLLDRLASSENRSDKAFALSTMIQKTNAQEMKWIIMIILKDLKLGMSEKSIFHEFHPDAEDLFNVTCDLKLVCEKLRDRSQRHKRQDIEVGKAVRPQLAMRVADATAAWKKLHGKEVVVECKFDGDRIQTHKNGTDVHYFSRNFIDHSEYAHAISDLIVQNILVDKCILDGEMLVWDTALNRFADFGSNQEIAKLAREGLDSHKQICYVAFDVLYVGDTSVIHQSLKERHELLRKVVKPLKGRLEILLPNGGLNTHRPSGEPLWSFIAHSVDDVEKFFKDTVENRDEGIVLKDLGSKWEPGDRSGKWLKLKPDYVRAGSDLDVLIIGGYYGSGRRGGEVAQFLVGLAERPELNAYPRRFISFCRVGTGLSDEELDGVVSKLKPHFRKYEYPKKTPPSFYQVTNHSKERPDVWIESPEKSIILSITSDIRTIRSEVFAAPYSLRFPRIDKVRHDKPWHECLDVQSFIELVHSSNGTTQKQKESESTQNKPESKKSSKREKRNNMPVVPSQFIQTDVSDVKGKTMIFSKLMFHFVNVPPSYSREALHKMVAENGGKLSMNLNNSVTHCIAAESSGIKYQAAKLHRDIIHYSWILDCCSQKKLLPLQPKYFLHLSEASKRKLQDEMDEFSDSYYWDLDLEGIKKFLANVPESDDSQKVEYYKKKYCAEQKWSCFHGCSIYFYLYSGSIESKELLGLISKRLGLEVLMAGGKLCNDLSHATHVIVLASPDDLVGFDSLTKSVGDAQKRFLSRKSLYIVGLSWLEDSLEKGLKLSEDPYSLRPIGVEEDDSDHDMEEVNTSVAQRNASPSFGTRKGKQKKEDPEDSSDIPPASKKRGDKTQRGRRGGRTAKRGRSSATQTSRTVRTRRGKMPSKLAADETDGSDDASIENSVSKEMDVVETITGNAETESSVAESQEPLKQGGFGVSRDIRRGKSIDEAPKFEKSLDLYETGGKAESGIVQESKDRREITGDPVQAMLMNMIPSLGIKQGEGSNPVKEDKHVSTVSEAGLGEKRRLDRTEIGKPDNTDDPGVAPVKKKKVSYKDIAGELLKDW